MTDPRPTLAVGMVGHAFMGAAHSQAWRTAPRFFDLPADPDHAGRCAAATPTARPRRPQRLGWAESETDWRRLVARDDVDLVDICTPGDTHAEIAIAALEAGKHVLCEKPLANTVAEAEADDRGRRAGGRATASARWSASPTAGCPAIALARQLVAEGRIGEVRHVRAQYLQDWIADPEAPLSWRLDKEPGRLRRARRHRRPHHRPDPAHHRRADHRGLRPARDLRQGAPDRRRTTRGLSGVGGATSAARSPSTTRRCSSPGSPAAALGVFEATRFATGRKNAIRIEINGSPGSLAFDFEDMNVLQLFDAAEPDETAGFRRILVTEPEHPYVGAWWPPGHGLGYEHGFTHQVVDLVTRASRTAPQPEPSLRRRAAGAAGAGRRRDQLRHPHLAGDPRDDA